MLIQVLDKQQEHRWSCLSKSWISGGGARWASCDLAAFSVAGWGEVEAALDLARGGALGKQGIDEPLPGVAVDSALRCGNVGA